MEHLTPSMKTCADLNSSESDALILVLDDADSLPNQFSSLLPTIKSHQKIVSKFNTGVHIMCCESLHHKKLILSFVGPLDRDYDDVRRIADAVKEGVCLSIKSGSTSPLLALAPLKAAAKLHANWSHPKALCLTALLSALHAVYVPLEVREFASLPPFAEANKSVKGFKILTLLWFSDAGYAIDHEKLLHIGYAIEEGRRVARDIGGSDPERMNASHIVEYLQRELADPKMRLTVQPVDPQSYPMAAIVDRGSNERHKGYIVHMDYCATADGNDAPSDALDLFLIGKGIIYDTGGSDLKVGGIMATMHRDKCGAAAVAGLFKTAILLKPTKIRLHGSLALVRNTISANAYVSDEIVVSRAGLRVRVNNTDAEGRMVMTDLLCEAKEKAAHLPNVHLMTFATLTGHAVLSYGTYTAVMCNGPARQMKADFSFQAAGELVGEMHEISTLRREDYEAHDALEDYADLLNAARAIGGKRNRGHQSPAAFMIRASGLDSHMSSSDKPIPYTHFDIAGSHGPCPGIPTATPLCTLASQFLLADYWEGVLPNANFHGRC